MNPIVGKLSFATIIGLIGSFFGAYVPVLSCVLVAIIFDFATGIVKSKVLGEPINSKTGTIGFWKKMALLLALFFGIFLDVFIPILLGVVSVNLPFKLPIGTIVGCYIVINESISIFENINKTAPSALPKWIKKLLQGAGKTIDKGGQTDEDKTEHS